MKKIIFIILASLMVACSSDDVIVSTNNDSDNVTLKFNVIVPDVQVASRSQSDNKFDHLCLIVFDEKGFFKETVQADNLQETSSSNHYTFTATLKKSDNKRIIHFLGTNKEISYNDAGPESNLNSLISENKEDAYWQRVVYDNINDQTKIIDIPLIRNFAKIKVSADKKSNFTLSGYYVINVLNKGTMIPQVSSDTNSFPSFTSGSTLLTYQQMLADQKYIGYEPSDASLINTDSNTGMVQPTKPFYMYEHSAKDKNNTSIIVRGRYSGDKSDSYYRIDLIYNDGNQTKYYNIIRNFEYDINIKSVYKSGKSSLSDALSSTVADNNIVASVETQSLLNVSNGESRLFVSFTDTTLVDNKAIVLKYKYIPDISNTTTNNSSVKLADIDNGNVIDSYKNNSSEKDANGFSSITITPKSPGNETKDQTINLYVDGNSNNFSLSRSVHFTLRKSYYMDVSTHSPIPQVLNSSVPVIITLNNDLPSKIFPLDFYIESKENSIYPNKTDYMPVKLGKSIIPNNNVNTYGFVKTITYNDYVNNKNGVTTSGNNKILTCNFLTNIEKSATDIYVYNKYFGTKYTSFANSSVAPPTVEYNTFTIPADALKFDESYNGKNVVIYSDSNCTSKVGSLVVNRQGVKHLYRYTNKDAITIKIPNDITTLYFKCGNKKGNATVSDLQGAYSDILGLGRINIDLN